MTRRSGNPLWSTATAAVVFLEPTQIGFLAFGQVGARTLAAPAELPVGVITAFVGAPFFCFVLWKGMQDA